MVGRSVGVRGDRAGEGVEVGAPHVGERSALGPEGGLAVEVDGDSELSRHSFAEEPGGGDGFRHGRLPERDEGADVDAAHARVDAAVLVYVEEVDGAPDEGEGALDDGRARPGEGEDRAVMVGVGVNIEKDDLSRGGYGGGESVEDGRGSANAYVGDALKKHGSSTGAGPGWDGEPAHALGAQYSGAPFAGARAAREGGRSLTEGGGVP